MRRPKLLAGIALLLLLALAGCSQPGSLEMRPVDDAEIGREATLDVPVPDADAPERVTREQRAIRGAILNGSTTVNATVPPVDGDRTGPYGHSTGVYELSYEVVDSHRETELDVKVDYDPADPTGDVVAYGDLPAVDRRTLDGLFPPREDRTDGWDVGTSALYDDAEVETSVLVGDRSVKYVRYDGKAYRIEVETRPETVKTYRYTATEIAPSEAAYGERLREDLAFTLEDLSKAERAVVESAIEDDYAADGDDDQAFAGVIEKLRSHEAVTEDEYRGEWIVRYEGEVYWVEARYSAYTE